MKSILFKNGRIVSSKGVANSDILVSNGKIKKIGKNLKVSNTEIIDLKNKLVFPGFIDGHTHFNLSVANTTTIDGFNSGTRAAISGGTTTIIDYATQYKGETLKEGYENWKKKTLEGVNCDYGFHMSISDVNDEVLKEIKDMFKIGITSFKLYTTYDVMIDDADMTKVLKELGKYKGLACVHCENDGMIKELRSEIKGADNKKVYSHAATRPKEAEADCVNRLIYMCEVAKTPFLAVHITNDYALKEVEKAKKEKKQVYGETCPQYLIFDDSVYKKTFKEASKYVIAPPLRKKSDNKYLMDGIKKGSIDIVSTDHCSFTMAQKSLGINDFRKIPGGLNGVEYRGPMFINLALTKKLPIEKVVEVLSENPAKLFGLHKRKGFIKEGFDADLVIVDDKKTKIYTEKNQVSASDYSVFKGKYKGLIESVYLRGEEIVRNGEVVNVGKGEYVKRVACAL